jgi:hypothetical protein
MVGLLLLPGWVQSAHAKDVVIGYSGRTVAEMPFAWAGRKGFFKERGVS